MADDKSRATDPGVRLFQLGAVKWVHCPRCAGPAREAEGRLSCKSCSHVEGGPKPNRRRLRAVVLAKQNPTCEDRQCGAPIPRVGCVVRGGAGDDIVAQVKCPTCGHVGRYPALAMSPRDVLQDKARFWRAFYRRGPSLYLSRRIGAHTLAVYNLQHLELLEEWLGARLRERGSVAGLTMMARLPRWMKAASARAKVLKALAELKEQAVREGLT